MSCRVFFTIISILFLSLFTQSAGWVAWNKTYGGEKFDGAVSVLQTSDGGYIIVGNTESYGNGKKDIWLIKTDAYGNIEWSKTYGGNKNDVASSIKQTIDGGYMIVGSTLSFGVNGDIWLLKTDSNGNLEWNKTLGGRGIDIGVDVQQTRDGGFIIVGISLLSTTGSELLLIKTDLNGNVLWTKTFKGAPFSGGFSVLETSDGGYIVLGLVESRETDIWLVKTDEQGNVLWSKTYGGKGFDFGMSILQTSDGGYLILGLVERQETDIWVVKINANGDMEWNMTLGGIYDDEGRSIQRTKDGGFVIVGTTRSYGAGDGDIWLIKLTPSQPQFDLTISVSPANQTVVQGESANYVVAVALTNGSPEEILLNVSGLPPGASFTFNPLSGSPTFTSTLIITTTSKTPPGKYQLTITASSGNIIKSVNIYLTVKEKEQVEKIRIVDAYFERDVLYFKVVNSGDSPVIIWIGAGISMKEVNPIRGIWDGYMFDIDHRIFYPNPLYLEPRQSKSYSVNIGEYIDKYVYEVSERGGGSPIIGYITVVLWESITSENNKIKFKDPISFVNIFFTNDDMRYGIAGVVNIIFMSFDGTEELSNPPFDRPFKIRVKIQAVDATNFLMPIKVVLKERSGFVAGDKYGDGDEVAIPFASVDEARRHSEITVEFNAQFYGVPRSREAIEIEVYHFVLDVGWVLSRRIVKRVDLSLEESYILGVSLSSWVEHKKSIDFNVFLRYKFTYKTKVLLELKDSNRNIISSVEKFLKGDDIEIITFKLDENITSESGFKSFYIHLRVFFPENNWKEYDFKYAGYPESLYKREVRILVSTAKANVDSIKPTGYIFKIRYGDKEYWALKFHRKSEYQPTAGGLLGLYESKYWHENWVILDSQGQVVTDDELYKNLTLIAEVAFWRCCGELHPSTIASLIDFYRTYSHTGLPTEILLIAGKIVAYVLTVKLAATLGPVFPIVVINAVEKGIRILDISTDVYLVLSNLEKYGVYTYFWLATRYALKWVDMDESSFTAIISAIILGNSATEYEQLNTYPSIISEPYKTTVVDGKQFASLYYK